MIIVNNVKQTIVVINQIRFVINQHKFKEENKMVEYTILFLQKSDIRFPM